ncbi:monosaccharide-sensing protein 2-like [Bombyx mandarina]|uniref:Monosaccharide-sensing protein 2-like n=1 Tax=Bombyx mandarina TaxID=7092 RepID=A0A6J2KVU9_BOMMA|nr:monosaccharide-sensing protein 2-like [Bombyx mandarina]
MCFGKQSITPFVKQCFAVSSVTFNMMSYGMVIGFNVSLFSELRKSQEIPLDRDSESWLASLIGITTFIGALFTPIIIDSIGRRPAVITSSVLMVSGWITLSLASSLPVLLVAKFLQGMSVGLGSTMGGLLIAEYSSPKYRGSFMATILTSLLLGSLISHLFGLFYNWHQISTILGFFSLPGLIISLFSPESPVFLATKGRYEQCRKVFRWLRGPNEDDELEKMIKTDLIVKESKKSRPKKTMSKIIQKKLTYVILTFKKREFYIPVFIVMHLSAIHQFCGALVYDTYAFDIHKALYGTDIYMFKVIASLDIQRILSTVVTVYLTSRVRRRPLLFTLVGLNILAYIFAAGYIYARRHSLLPFDHMAIGVFLHHFHYFTNGAGSMPLTTIISNELFPTADKGFCGLICSMVFSMFMFANIKSAPYLFSLIDVEGTLCAYALLLFYCQVMLYYMLPETKDKTLQEIEDKFRGFSLVDRAEVLKTKDDEDVSN